MGTFYEWVTVGLMVAMNTQLCAGNPLFTSTRCQISPVDTWLRASGLFHHRSCPVRPQSLEGPPLVGQWWSSHCEHFCSRKVHSGELCLGWSWKILKCRHWKPVPLRLLIKRSLKFIAVGKCQDSQVRKRTNGWNSRRCWFEVTTMYLFGPIWV